MKEKLRGILNRFEQTFDEKQIFLDEHTDEAITAIESLYQSLYSELYKDEIEAVNLKLAKVALSDYITKEEAFNICRDNSFSLGLMEEDVCSLETLRKAFDVERSCITKSINSEENNNDYH